MTRLLELASRADRIGITVTRLGLIVVLFWIGGLKFFTYEADGIVPFVANSPFMSFFYDNPSEYKKYTNKEGELITQNHQWNIQNNTYGFANGLGILLIGIAFLVAIHHWAPLASMLGSILVFILT